MGLPGGRGIDTGADPFVRSLDSDAQDRRIVQPVSELCVSTISHGIYPWDGNSIGTVQYINTAINPDTYMYVPLHIFKTVFYPRYAYMYFSQVGTDPGAPMTCRFTFAFCTRTRDGKEDNLVEVPGTKAQFTFVTGDTAGNYRQELLSGTKLLAGKQYYIVVHSVWIDGLGVSPADDRVRVATTKNVTLERTHLRSMLVYPESTPTKVDTYKPRMPVNRLAKLPPVNVLYWPLVTYFSGQGEELVALNTDLQTS